MLKAFLIVVFMIFCCHFCFYVHFIYIDLKLGLFISERLSIDLLLFATFQVITPVAVGGSRPCLPPACSCPPWVPGTWWGVVDKQHHHSPWTQGKVWKLTPCVRTMLAWGPHIEWCCKAWFYITIFNITGSQYPGMPNESMPNGPVSAGYTHPGPPSDYSSPLTHMSESINNITNGNSMNNVSSMNSVPQSDSSSQMTHNSGQYVPVSGDQGMPTLRHPDQNSMNSHMTPSSQSSQSMSNGSHQLDHQSPPTNQNHSSGADNCNSIEDINLDPSTIMNDSQSNNLDVSTS